MRKAGHDRKRPFSATGACGRTGRRRPPPDAPTDHPRSDTEKESPASCRGMPGRRCLWGTLWTGLRRTEPGTRENWEKPDPALFQTWMLLLRRNARKRRSRRHVTHGPDEPSSAITRRGGGGSGGHEFGPCARMRPRAVEECGFRGHSAGLRYGSLTTKAHESGPSRLSWKRQGYGRGGLDLCASSSRSPPAPWSRSASRLHWTAAGPRGGSETV